ncbi:MADS-box protein SOC1-like [Dioscorea cayenensis subsp. rotundata]|uniref:MADS-box protein SOC1-like n=1 Tax=Dioscorea cayennensis subsp. rotundata TaxID=55577 RepID=A0AB40ALH1_DIOCR|nr:MADS-box protein SOC1-like [Dioscorea cayenensis subsp. rotundata]
MGRVKVKLAWIEKAAARNATYKKRKNGLLKKVKDLSTLCDVKACAIIYPCRGTVLEVWSLTLNPIDVLVPFMQEPELGRRKKMCLDAKDLSRLDLETMSHLSWLVDNKLKLVKEKVAKKKAEIAANGEGSSTTSAARMHGWCLGFNEQGVIIGEQSDQPSCGNVNPDDGDDDNIAWFDGIFLD